MMNAMTEPLPIPQSVPGRIRVLSESLARLRVAQEAMLAALHDVQDALVFGLHPELVELDGMLDNCYPDPGES